MKKNVGSIDRTVRIILALAVAILILTGNVTGLLAILLGVLALVFVATGIVNFCPLYALFGLSSRKDGPAK